MLKALVLAIIVAIIIIYGLEYYETLKDPNPTLRYESQLLKKAQSGDRKARAEYEKRMRTHENNRTVDRIDAEQKIYDDLYKSDQQEEKRRKAQKRKEGWNE